MSAAAASALPQRTGNRDQDRRLVRSWLYALATMVLLIIVVGGATRLTESGLSITEWEPIHGVVPPRGDAEWLEEFAKYQTIPEFQIVNPDMTLAEFKAIYWWEWTHRILARLIGVVFLVPFLFLLLTGRIERSLWPRLVAIFVLGGLQGAVGWWMVASGLSERTDVSQYRLATHLILAALIFSYLLWVARGLRPYRPALAFPGAVTRFVGNLLIVLLFLQLYLGGLVAGLNAGLVASDWPTMGGEAIPGGLFALEPTWRNFFENEITVHFFHRVLAYLIAALIVAHALLMARSWPGTRLAFSSYRLLLLVAVQVTLGVATVLWLVPIPLALAHQFVAILLLGGVVMHRRGMTPPLPVRG